jgi:putative ABC transport system permease protein
MKLVPIAYNWRSLWVRRGSTLLTVVSIGATVAVIAAVLALQQGFSTLFTERGRTDLVVLLRPGSKAEGNSGFTRRTVDIVLKGSPEFAVGADGKPLMAAETYLAVRRAKQDGGETNVPIRGVQQASFAIHGDDFRIVEGRNLEPGSDEVIIGRRMAGRIRDAEVGDVLQINVTPFRVVGVFEAKGAYESEIWGDVERIKEALDRPVYNRMIGVLAPGNSLEDLNDRLAEEKRASVTGVTEREYLEGQTEQLSGLFFGLGIFLTVVMGFGAVFTGINSMYSTIAARTHEVGVLLSIGFRPFSIFLSFVAESLLLGLLGGLFGVLAVLPLNGVETGTMNLGSFSEAAFEFRTNAFVLGTGVVIALLLGLIGGAVPAWRAARMQVVTALRRH